MLRECRSPRPVAVPAAECLFVGQGGAEDGGVVEAAADDQAFERCVEIRFESTHASLANNF
jgi:hypothetical protein